MSASFLGLANSTFYPGVDIKLLLFYCLLLLVHSTSNINRRFTKKNQTARCMVLPIFLFRLLKKKDNCITYLRPFLDSTPHFVSASQTSKD
jgi:hypothetical protein